MSFERETCDKREPSGRRRKKKQKRLFILGQFDDNTVQLPTGIKTQEAEAINSPERDGAGSRQIKMQKHVEQGERAVPRTSQTALYRRKEIQCIGQECNKAIRGGGRNEESCYGKICSFRPCLVNTSHEPFILILHARVSGA